MWVLYIAYDGAPEFNIYGPYLSEKDAQADADRYKAQLSNDALLAWPILLGNPYMLAKDYGWT